MHLNSFTLICQQIDKMADNQNRQEDQPAEQNKGNSIGNSQTNRERGVG